MFEVSNDRLRLLSAETHIHTHNEGFFFPPRSQNRRMYMYVCMYNNINREQSRETVESRSYVRTWHVMDLCAWTYLHMFCFVNEHSEQVVHLYFLNFHQRRHSNRNRNRNRHNLYNLRFVLSPVVTLLLLLSSGTLTRFLVTIPKSIFVSPFTEQVGFAHEQLLVSWSDVPCKYRYRYSLQVQVQVQVQCTSTSTGTGTVYKYKYGYSVQVQVHVQVQLTSTSTCTVYQNKYSLQVQV